MRCDGTSLVVSGADVRVRRRVTPRYPVAARTLDIAETRCIVAFSISSRGLPESIHIDGCPQVFHASLREAAQQWRFYPVRDATGQPSPASFRLAVVFKLQD